jgi:GSH-dependent disulfide-bond oxidoreductase
VFHLAGIKAAMALEEIVSLRATTEDFNYEAHTVDIRHAENRKADFTEAINPNAKIPALVDPHGIDGRPVTVWESGAIMLYLAEKYNELMPRDDPVRRAEMMSWLFWGSTGFSSQVKLFGFYFKHTTQMDYCVERYAKECHRLLGVLNKQLTKHGKQYVIGGERYCPTHSNDVMSILKFAQMNTQLQTSLSGLG